MAREVGRFVYWAPRILSIVFILFLALFSLDVFDSNPGFWEAILGLFIHNIPSLALLIVLLISWRHEIVGAVAFTLAGLAYIVLVLTNPSVPWYLALSWSLIIAVPALLVGFLFFINWRRKKEAKKKELERKKTKTKPRRKSKRKK